MYLGVIRWGEARDKARSAPSPKSMPMTAIGGRRYVGGPERLLAHLPSIKLVEMRIPARSSAARVYNGCGNLRTLLHLISTASLYRQQATMPLPPWHGAKVKARPFCADCLFSC